MYTYKQLKILHKIVEAGGFSKAASELYLTQPAVSWQIKSMEEAIGLPLIERYESGLKLTAVGEIVMRHADIIIQQFSNLNTEIEQFKCHHNTSLILAASSIPGEFILPYILNEFKLDHPDVVAKLIIVDSHQVTEHVLTGKSCFGISGYIADHPLLDAIPWKNEHLKLVVSEKHSRKIFDPKQETLIIREIGSGTRNTTEDFLKTIGYSVSDFKEVIEFGSSRACLSAIESGMGLGWLSEYAIQDALQLSKIREMDTKYAIKRSLYIITHKHRKLSKIAQHLIETLVTDL